MPHTRTRSTSKTRTPSKVAKRPFRLSTVLARIRRAIESYPKAALFELAADGFDSTFEQLAACIISIRTRDEVTVPVARQLFAKARTPAEVARLSVASIDKLIGQCTFHEAKARQIHNIAQQAVDRFVGKLPCDKETLLSLHGVGPKCAALVLGIACGEPGVGVDIHVHRVTNRWGYIEAGTPEKTMAARREAAEEKLDRA